MISIDNIIMDLILLRRSIEFNEFCNYGTNRIDPKWTFRITKIIEDLEIIKRADAIRNSLRKAYDREERILRKSGDDEK